jgi:outer membrane protein
VFTNTVTAYMDVIRDAGDRGPAKEQRAGAGINLQATSDRFEIGDVTRTDVAQSRSRLALARASLRQAEANLVASRETYVQVVGHAPAAGSAAAAGRHAATMRWRCAGQQPRPPAAREQSKAAGLT